MKFTIKDFLSKCDQIRRKLILWYWNLAILVSTPVSPSFAPVLWIDVFAECSKKGADLLQIGAGISNRGRFISNRGRYFKSGQLFQIGAEHSCSYKNNTLKVLYRKNSYAYKMRRQCKRYTEKKSRKLELINAMDTTTSLAVTTFSWLFSWFLLTRSVSNLTSLVCYAPTVMFCFMKDKV